MEFAIFSLIEREEDRINIGRMRCCRYTSNDSRSAQYQWERCYSRHPNVLMILSGHQIEGLSHVRTSRGLYGNDVVEILQNYPELPYSDWIRLYPIVSRVELSKDGDEAVIRYYLCNDYAKKKKKSGAEFGRDQRRHRGARAGQAGFLLSHVKAGEEMMVLRAKWRGGRPELKRGEAANSSLTFGSRTA